MHSMSSEERKHYPDTGLDTKLRMTPGRTCGDVDCVTESSKAKQVINRSNWKPIYFQPSNAGLSPHIMQLNRKHQTNGKRLQYREMDYQSATLGIYFAYFALGLLSSVASISQMLVLCFEIQLLDPINPRLQLF